MRSKPDGIPLEGVVASPPTATLKREGMAMEANRKEQCDFDIDYNGERWHIEMVWKQSNGKIAWYDGITYRDGVAFYRIFGPKQLNIPGVTKEG